MKTAKRRSQHARKNKNKNKRTKTSKKWETPIERASQSYAKTGSLQQARTIFKAQALVNARKLFGYTTTQKRF
jgi:hypothetical protein